MSAIAGSSTVPDVGNDMYEIYDFGKKGKGMVAAKDLSPGDVILVEKPILVVDSEDLKAIHVYKEYLKLSENDQRRFKDLTHHADYNDISAYAKGCGREQDRERGKLIAKFNTNCMEDQSSTKRFVAVECARMNHSCSPNTTYDYFEKSVVVRALQKIAKGQEILIPYVPPMWSKKQREEKLWSDWGFKCDCEACNKAPLMTEKVRNDLENVNNKLMDIRNRGRKGSKNADTMEPEKQIQCCKFFVERTVSIKALIPYTVAMLEIYLRLLELTNQSATPEAKKWYGEAYRLALICRGPDNQFVKHCADMLKTF